VVVASVFDMSDLFRAGSVRITIHHFHEKAKSSQAAVADFLCFLLAIIRR
jgi:hypothetical protein